jgi:hypothetical protein
MSPSANAPSRPSEPQVGDRVLIEGTGRWWTGSTFIAVIADVDDKTFKVRYEDGGYKRFPRQAFQALVVS